MILLNYTGISLKGYIYTTIIYALKMLFYINNHKNNILILAVFDKFQAMGDILFILVTYTKPYTLGCI